VSERTFDLRGGESVREVKTQRGMAIGEKEGRCERMRGDLGSPERETTEGGDKRE
jgi:hypothetical protein